MVFLISRNRTGKQSYLKILTALDFCLFYAKRNEFHVDEVKTAYDKSFSKCCLNDDFANATMVITILHGS